MINIAVIYGRIMFICHKFIECSISGRNIQHSMLYFHKENIVVLKKCQKYCQTFVSIFGRSKKINLGGCVDSIADTICQLHC